MDVFEWVVVAERQPFRAQEEGDAVHEGDAMVLAAVAQEVGLSEPALSRAAFPVSR